MNEYLEKAEINLSLAAVSLQEAHIISNPGESIILRDLISRIAKVRMNLAEFAHARRHGNDPGISP